MKRVLAALPLALAAVLPAQAYTPSSGFWLNLNESGTGLAMEIEDKSVFIAAYVFDAQGRTQWFTSSGSLTSSVVGGQTYFNVYTDQLDGFANGQVIGGPYIAPQYFPSAGGPISIVFNPADETRATLTWGGRTMQIQRLDYFAGLPVGDREIERMIGEWSVLVDLYNRGGDYQFYPYYGDVLVFDLLNRAPNPDLFEGCRPDTSQVGRCSTNALTYHDAAGYYDPVLDEHVAIVTDAVASSGNPALYWAYYLEVNTADFEGVVELYFGNENPGDGPYYPVRGFRSASRSFVLSNGPSAHENDPKAAVTDGRSMAKRIMADNGGVMPEGMTAEEVKTRYGIDVKAHAQKVRELQATLGK